MDEVDWLLEQGCIDFIVDLEVILVVVLVWRQILLFSVMLIDIFWELQGLVINQFFFWEVQVLVSIVEQLDQCYLLVFEKVKDVYLVYLIQCFQDEYEDWFIIIFINICKICQILCMMLCKFSFFIVVFYFMMKQKECFVVLVKFKFSIYWILIVIDVVFWGLDIFMVQVVINYNIFGFFKIYIY